MSIVAGDILFQLSGGSGNTDPNASLGGAVSTTQITDNTLDNLFNDVTGDQHTAGFTSYRAFFVKNNNGTLTAFNTKVWIDTNTTSADESIQIGIEATKGTPKQTIVNETTAPTGISFFSAVNQAASLSLGSLLPADVYMIWVKRTVTTGSTPLAADSAVIKFYVDTI